MKVRYLLLALILGCKDGFVYPTVTTSEIKGLDVAWFDLESELTEVQIPAPDLKEAHVYDDKSENGEQEIGDAHLEEEMFNALCPELTCILCRPCITDQDCNYNNTIINLCIENGEYGRFCGISCVNDKDCPAGYECQTIKEEIKQCIITADKCPCIEPFLTFQTVCYQKHDDKVCQGLRRCDEECPELSPTDEICNGIDDDCDGETDEDIGYEQCGVGVCAHAEPKCLNGKPNKCNPLLGMKEEECNGLDDDCDSLTDEDLGETTCGIGECMHTVKNCEDGKPKPCDPLELAKPEVCDNKDNDCDGETDEDLEILECGVGACKNEVFSCILGVPQTCIPKQPKPENCNNEDDDCNGVIDDMGTVTCGEGVCKVTIPVCINGTIQTCVPNKNAASQEKCDGIDNDCDGLTDEVGCPCYVAQYKGHSYLFCTTEKSWDTAKNGCTNHGEGYHLVIINDAEENKWLKDQAQAVNKNKSWWIGLSEPNNDGKWFWVDGTPLSTSGIYANWAEGEPNNYLGAENCGMMYGNSGKWNDSTCWYGLRYICEHE